MHNSSFYYIQEKSEIQGTYLNLIKAICVKPIGNIKLNGLKLKGIALISRTKYGLPLSYSLFNVVLEVLHTAIRQLKEFKGIQTGKK